MIKNTASRRTFLQYLASIVAAAFVPHKLMANPREKTSSTVRPYQHGEDSEFVIIDGWVLLKKDLEE